MPGTRNKITSSFSQIRMGFFFFHSIFNSFVERNVCVLCVYFIINFKRGLATTRNTHSICQVAWILFFIGFSVVFFPVFRSWLLAAFVITFCGFVAAFLNAVCYMLDSVFCVLCRLILAIWTFQHVDVGAFFSNCKRKLLIRRVVLA